MPILSTQSLILPDDANLGGAYQQVVPVANPAPGAFAQHINDGQSYEVIVSALCQVTTDAVAGNRELLFLYNDADGNSLAQIAAVSTQPPGSTRIYQGTLGQSFAWFDGLTRFSGPLVPIVLMQGWRFTLFCAPGGGTDQIAAVQLVIQRYPTGTPASSRPAPAAPALV